MREKCKFYVSCRSLLKLKTTLYCWAHLNRVHCLFRRGVLITHLNKGNSCKGETQTSASKRRLLLAHEQSHNSSDALFQHLSVLRARLELYLILQA